MWPNLSGLLSTAQAYDTAISSGSLSSIPDIYQPTMPNGTTSNIALGDPNNPAASSEAGLDYAPPTSGQGGSTYDAQAAAEAQRKAEEAARVQSLRDEITARRTRANDIFSSLTEAVSSLAREKRGELEASYGEQQKSATDQFNQQSGLIANRYRGRGLGDSSYKAYALEDAGNAYQNATAQLGRERQQGLADVGGYVEEQNARIGADRQAANYDNLMEVGLREDGTYDPEALMELRAKIDERIREAEVQKAQMGTNAGFRGTLNQVAPYKGAVDVLKQSLTSLASSAAPKAVKDKIAQTLIGNYAPEDGSTWTNFYSEEEKKATA